LFPYFQLSFRQLFVVGISLCLAPATLLFYNLGWTVYNSWRLQTNWFTYPHTHISSLTILMITYMPEALRGVGVVLSMLIDGIVAHRLWIVRPVPTAGHYWTYIILIFITLGMSQVVSKLLQQSVGHYTD
jgi:hypothetical protein